jgi:hypothetical protein
MVYTHAGGLKMKKIFLFCCTLLFCYNPLLAQCPSCPTYSQYEQYTISDGLIQEVKKNNEIEYPRSRAKYTKVQFASRKTQAKKSQYFYNSDIQYYDDYQPQQTYYYSYPSYSSGCPSGRCPGGG